MKHLTTLITILFISLLSSPSLSETVSLGDLVKRNDLYFEKFTDVPFTGEVSGQYNGKFKNGKRKGKWLSYYSNGGLSDKGNFKDGKSEGLWVFYHENGQLSSKGNFKDGKSEGLWVNYHKNGQLRSKGNKKNGGKDGRWKFFTDYGTLRDTGTYKNGLLVE